MTRREFRDFLDDILGAIALIETMTKGMSFEEFSSRNEVFLAVVKLIEVIGEAVKNIPDEVRVSYAQVPWRNMAGMRTKLVHDYWAIDERVIWQVVIKELPRLQETVIQMVKELAEDE